MFKLELNIIGSCVLILIFVGCQKKDAFADIKIIGHAGNGLANINTLYHDNSLESIKLALSTDGCDGVELDVQLSSDNTLWLYHDDNLNTETNGEGCIPQAADSYLENITYTTLNKEPLIRLSDVPADYLIGKVIYIDIRSLNNCTGFEVSLAECLAAMNAFRSENPTSEIVICTGAMSWLTAFKNSGYSVMAEIRTMEEYDNLIVSFPLLDGIIVSNSNITQDEVYLIQEDDMGVVIFDVRSAFGIRKAMKKLPNAIMTDNIRKALIEKY